MGLDQENSGKPEAIVTKSTVMIARQINRRLDGTQLEHVISDRHGERTVATANLPQLGICAQDARQGMTLDPTMEWKWTVQAGKLTKTTQVVEFSDYTNTGMVNSICQR